MRSFVIAAVAIFALAGIITTSAQALTKASAYTNAGDFAQALQSSGQFEMESSTVALQKTNNEELRTFAQKMIDDHKAAAQKLMDTLKQANLPAPEYAILTADRDKINTLTALTGAQFERKYIEDQITAHREAASLLEMYSQRGDNAALKQLAANLLPTIKEHLQAAEGLHLNVTAKR